jgi:signal transduction histidine kinase
MRSYSPLGIGAKAHGGEIKVEAREDEGSEFIIQLPNTA